MSIVVDHQEVRTQAGFLHNAAIRVDEVAPSIPTTVDGGIGTAAILGILADFVTSAGELVIGLGGMSGVLNDCAARYAEQDIAAADEINVAAWSE